MKAEELMIIGNELICRGRRGRTFRSARSYGPRLPSSGRYILSMDDTLLSWRRLEQYERWISRLGLADSDTGSSVSLWLWPGRRNAGPVGIIGFAVCGHVTSTMTVALDACPALRWSAAVFPVNPTACEGPAVSLIPKVEAAHLANPGALFATSRMFGQIPLLGSGDCDNDARSYHLLPFGSVLPCTVILSAAPFKWFVHTATHPGAQR